MSISEELPVKTGKGKCSEATPANISTISLRWFPEFRYRLFYRFVVSSAVVRAQHPRFFSWLGGWAPKAEGSTSIADLPDEVLVVLLRLLRHR